MARYTFTCRERSTLFEHLIQLSREYSLSSPWLIRQLLAVETLGGPDPFGMPLRTYRFGNRCAPDDRWPQASVLLVHRGFTIVHQPDDPVMRQLRLQTLIAQRPLSHVIDETLFLALKNYGLPSSLEQSRARHEWVADIDDLMVASGLLHPRRPGEPSLRDILRSD